MIEAFSTVAHSKEWQAKPRVWACLMLHSVCVGQEIASVNERGKLRPLSQTDIAAELQLDVKSVHQCVVALENERCVVRRRPVNSQFRKSGVELVCFAAPATKANQRRIQSETPTLAFASRGIVNPLQA